MNPLLIGGIIDTVGKVADSLFTSDEERARLQIDARKVETDAYRAESERMAGQVETNKVEAANNAAWRPLIGKVCGYAFAYNFIIHPALSWVWSLFVAFGWIPGSLPPPPGMDIEPLMALTTGMLGLGVYRTVEKIKGRA